VVIIIVETIKCDILIIGGGLAGLMAALSASRKTKNIVIVSKGAVGRSGNTLVSGGGIASANPEENNSTEQFFSDLNASGKGLNNPLLTKKLAEESPLLLNILEKCGVKLVRENGVFKRRQPPGHSVPRNIPTDWTGISYLNRGLSFTLPLLAKIKDLEIDVLEGITIFKLIKDNDRVSGALGIDKKNNLYHFAAGNIILAAGGGGHIFSRTNNTKDITGNTFSLALEAGCHLQDMEQVQFYPTMMTKPFKMPISNPLFGAGAVLLNKNKEEFMSNYDPAGNMATRDRMAQAIFWEILAGRGIDGGVYFDCTRISRKKLTETFKDFYQFLIKKGIDPTREYLVVAPSVHFFLGGIIIDEYCRTGISGLYAAGEACGGVHGANRLSGAALMEACVFGWQAGEIVGEESGKKPLGIPAYLKLQLNTENTNISQKIKAIQKTMWENVSVIRNEQNLKKVINQIEAMKETMPDGLSPEIVEYKSILKTAEVIVLSALTRNESRGAHYRSDYPLTNDKFRGNIICQEADEKVKVKFISRI